MVETLVEFCRNRLARGMAINRTPQVFEIQLLDTCFYNPMRKGVAGVDIALDRFEFLRPERMGYLPGPHRPVARDGRALCAPGEPTPPRRGSHPQV